ncbi:hypothetical protein DyAD56_16275 [Dyella sp. AD56]|uniref:hypothetical protein n=1 Tax=Dyella sp. AD56 TaxID=1528744 RepID=UPI000C83FCDB|nr:hypothetical protein [Dyella sp. AD56]PMQ04245.1 hypothetical protein DyAD56_16275 [Dyella sp. AD56]
MKHGLLERIEAEASRLELSRVGIAAFGRRQAAHLAGRLEAAQALPEGEWRNMSVRALEVQAQALIDELARLSAPAPHSKEYEHGC